MERRRRQGGKERRCDLYCLLPCHLVVLNQPLWDPGGEKGGHTLSIWPGEDVNISFLAVQMSLVSIVCLFCLYFPWSLKPSASHIISFPMPVHPSLISFILPSFDDLKTCLFKFSFISSFPLSSHFLRSCLKLKVENKALETLITVWLFRAKVNCEYQILSANLKLSIATSRWPLGQMLQ